MEALDANGFSWKAVSLHDNNGRVPGGVYCCGSSLTKFIINVIRFAGRDTVIIWNHVSLGALLPYAKLLLRNRGNILITYGTESWDEALTSRKKRAFFSMDEVWAISSYTKERLIRSHGLEENKFRLFPCCISTGVEKAYANPYPSGYFHIMTLLRLDKSRKLSAVYNMVDALPALLKRGIPAHFTVVGRGNDEESVQSYVKERGMQGHVTFTGYVEETGSYLEHCDLFTLISDGEGFGIVYLEAMEYGKCCVAAKDCGSQDVVLDGQTGLSVLVDDIPALETALVKLATNDTLRKAMGDEGRNHLMEHFTFNAFKVNQRNLLKRWS